jgi:hypothetical protein
MKSMRLAGTAGMAVAVLAALPAAAFEAGSRAYFLLPEGTSSLQLNAFTQTGNQNYALGSVVVGSTFDLTAGYLQYTRTFNLNGNQGAFYAALPYGSVSAELNTPFGTLSGEQTGIPDPVIGVIFGLTGAPSLGLDDYKTFDPDFGAGALIELSLPLGQYDADELLNLGANRWAAQFGIPLSYGFGDSTIISPDLTLLEVTPSVTFFGDNTDATGGGTISQDPIFLVEAHLSRNLNRALWVSADAVYTYGGETTTNGVADDNVKESLGLGATVGFALSPATQIKITYGEIVSGNDNGADGRGVRLVATVLF